MEEINLNLDEGNNEKQQKRKNIWISIVVIFAIFCLIFMIVYLTSNETIDKELEISNISMSVEYNEYLGYSVTITGTAKNVSGKNLSYACVEFSVYDGNGNNLGTAIDNINNLLKGDTWTFKAVLFDFPDTKPTSYKLIEITAW